MGAIIQLVKSLAGVIPYPVMIAVIVGAVLLGLPGFLKNIRARQIRRAVQQVARTTTRDARRLAEDATLEMAGADAHLVLQVAEEALRLNQRALCERAVVVLERLDSLPTHARRLRKELSPPVPAHDAAIEALAAIKVLADAGLTAQAQAKLVAARARFPDDAGLRELTVPVDPPAPLDP